MRRLAASLLLSIARPCIRWAHRLHPPKVTVVTLRQWAEQERRRPYTFPSSCGIRDLEEALESTNPWVRRSGEPIWIPPGWRN